MDARSVCYATAPVQGKIVMYFSEQCVTSRLHPLTNILLKQVAEMLVTIGNKKRTTSTSAQQTNKVHATQVAIVSYKSCWKQYSTLGAAANVACVSARIVCWLYQLQTQTATGTILRCGCVRLWVCSIDRVSERGDWSWPYAPPAPRQHTSQKKYFRRLPRCYHGQTSDCRNRPINFKKWYGKLGVAFLSQHINGGLERRKTPSLCVCKKIKRRSMNRTSPPPPPPRPPSSPSRQSLSTSGRKHFSPPANSCL